MFAFAVRLIFVHTSIKCFGGYRSLEFPRRKFALDLVVLHCHAVVHARSVTVHPDVFRRFAFPPRSASFKRSAPRRLRALFLVPAFRGFAYRPTSLLLASHVDVFAGCC
ncbi:hypothetical protein R1flu_003008 [Riccia fluitans]|uniref:Secreted protein n=1 Tax=Riccia fluitans TaxID=41844 RepID=A0ABD1Y7Y9_9MARC